MKTITKFAAFLLIAAGSFYSCNKEENNEPIEIPITEYSLAGTSCQWTNLSYDGKVIIINSNAALESYLTNARSSGYPAIDFSKYSLLLVSDATENGVVSVTVEKMQKLTATNYELRVEIILNTAIAGGEWVMALVIDKLSEGSIVNLKTTTDDTETPPAEIIKELPKMYLNGNLTAGEHAVIQSKTELLALFPQEEINKSVDLQEIDFNTQTLLIGRDDYGYGACFNYEFYLTEKNQYIFKVDIFGGYATMDYNFLYGIIVGKLPATAEVIFNISKQTHN